MPLSRRSFLASSLAMALVGCGGDGRSKTAATPTTLDPSLSRYLQGPYGPVAEERTLTDLEVVGSLPPELTGAYVRNGPNPWPIPTGEYDWFTGDGMVHGVRLDAGRATWYRNRWIRTEARGDDPGGPPEPFAASANKANTSIVQHAGKTMALYEVGLPHELDDELGTVGRIDPADGSVVTAHPKLDPATGELHLFGYVPGLRYAVLDAGGRLLRSTPVDVGRISMMHDFSLTERYAVFFDLPVVFDPALVEKPLPFSWQPEGGSRVGVVPRDHSAPVRWFDLDENAFAFHTLNAWDEGDRVVVDLARHESFLAGPTSTPPALHRWTIDLAGGRVTDERLDDRPVEFPRVAPGDVGRRHERGWSVALGPTSEGSHDIGSGLVWHDLRAGTSRHLDLGAGVVAGEPTYVDGWLLSLVLDQAAGTSELVVLSADDPDEGVVGRVRLPVRVPVGFHGTFVTSS